MQNYSLSFIKIDIDIINNKKIRLLRSYPEPDALCWLWIALISLSMQSKRLGFIELTEGQPYEIDQLSKITDIPAQTIKMALNLYEKLKMIEIINNTPFIVGIKDHQEIDQIEHKRELNRIRVMRYREKAKLALEYEIPEDFSADNFIKKPSKNESDVMLTGALVMDKTRQDKKKTRQEKDKTRTPNNYPPDFADFLTDLRITLPEFNVNKSMYFVKYSEWRKQHAK